MGVRLKATGARGSWFAKIGGTPYPCLHKHWVNPGGSYLDRGLEAQKPKWQKYISALKAQKKAILTDDTVVEGEAFKRSNYIALYEIDNVETTDAGLALNLVKRLEELK